MKKKPKKYAFENSNGERVWFGGDVTLGRLVEIGIKVDLADPGTRPTKTHYIHDPTRSDQVR